MAKDTKKIIENVKLDIAAMTADELAAKIVELKALNQEQLLANAMSTSPNVRAAKNTQRTIARLMTRAHELTFLKEGEKE